MSAPVAVRPPTGVSGLGSLTLRLTRARFASRQGESLLYGASVLAYTVASALAFTVAGGTWMFYDRWRHPSGLLGQVVAEDKVFDAILAVYVGLAIFACCLLVPSVASLAASGAQLGARGRERRLASLRLLGLSSGDVTRMALLDAVIQSIIGTALGAVLYLVTLPAWGALEMQAMVVRPFDEMLVPWWLGLTVAAALVVLGVMASAWGLRQVRISPLGVARRANRPGARWWRVVTFLVLVGIAYGISSVTSLGGSKNIALPLTIMGIMVVLTIIAIDIAGPWVLQQVARALSHVPTPATMWASRRIIADPKTTWRRSASLGMLAFLGAYVCIMPITVGNDNSHATETGRTFMHRAAADFSKGALITLAVGFALTATAILITQASATIERAEQSRALHRMGASEGFGLRTMWLETFGPIVSASLIGAGLGSFLALPMANAIARSVGARAGEGVWLLLSVLGAGLAVAAAALAACHPLAHRLLQVQERKND